MKNYHFLENLNFWITKNASFYKLRLYALFLIMIINALWGGGDTKVNGRINYVHFCFRTPFTYFENVLNEILLTADSVVFVLLFCLHISPFHSFSNAFKR